MFGSVMLTYIASRTKDIRSGTTLARFYHSVSRSYFDRCHLQSTSSCIGWVLGNVSPRRYVASLNSETKIY